MKIKVLLGAWALIFLSSASHVPAASVLSMPIYPQFGQFKNMPGPSYFSSLGMNFVPFCISRNLTGGLPDKASVISDVNKLTAINPHPIVCVDIESLHFDIRNTNKTTVDKNIAYFKQIIGWIRAANPTAKVGFYGIMPVYDYWTLNNYYDALRLTVAKDPWWTANLSKFQQAYQAWQNANAYLSGLAGLVDFTAPSFYMSSTLYSQPENSWAVEVLYTTYAARGYGKPTYPFLWPQWQNTTSYMPDVIWKAMLRDIRLYGDGMFIWNSGSFHNETWNATAFWWQDVLSLANSLSAPGALGGHTELEATPPDGVYPASSIQHVSLTAAHAGSIRYSVTTNWPNTIYPSCTTGTTYTGPINIAASKIILATACYPDGSSMNASFAYVLK